MAIDGNYTISFTTPIGKQELGLAFQSDGNVLTGTTTSGGNTEAFRDGKVNGNELEFVMDAKTPMGKMKTTIIATVSGDQISGTIKTMMGKSKFEGVRVG